MTHLPNASVAGQRLLESRPVQLAANHTPCAPSRLERLSFPSALEDA